MPKLIFVRGIREGESFCLKPPGIFIGRETDNDLQLLVEGVSRYHAKIALENNAWVLCDLGSSNGVKVDNEKITRKLLEDRDLIRIGEQVLRFLDDPREESAIKPEAEPGKTASAPDGKSAGKLPPDASRDERNLRFQEKDREIQKMINEAIAEKQRRLRRIFIWLTIILNLLVLAAFAFYLSRQGKF